MSATKSCGEFADSDRSATAPGRGSALEKMKVGFKNTEDNAEPSAADT